MSKHGDKQSVKPVVEQAETEPVAAPVAAPKAKKATRKTEAQLLVAYPHVVPGTLRLESEGKWAGKQTVEATLECGHVERLATSDLFQVKRCHECKRPAKKQAKPKETSPKGEVDGVTSANYPGKPVVVQPMQSEDLRAIGKNEG